MSTHLSPKIIMYVLSHFSFVQLFMMLWTIACQAPMSMTFARQEYWSRLPFPSPGDLPHPGIEPHRYVPCLGRWVRSISATWEAKIILMCIITIFYQ